MWDTLNTEQIFSNRYVKLSKNKVQLDNNKIIDDFYTITIPDAAMVCAITDDSYIILKKEFRYACNSDVIECPAGMFEENEKSPLEVAKRELLEETGYTSKDWMYLGGSQESTSKLTNTMHLFFAKNCKKTAEQKTDSTESIELIKVPFKTAVDMVMRGEITANSTAHLILKVARLMNL